MTVFLQVLVLLWGAVIAIALVRALMPRGAESEVQLRRRRAEWLTVALGLIGAYLLAVIVKALVGSAGPNPVGMVPYVVFCAYLPIAVIVLRAVWRRWIEAARAESDAALPPMTEPLSPRNTALSGEDEPPQRW